MSRLPARRAAVVAVLVLLAAGIWGAGALRRESRLDAVAGAPAPVTFVRDVAPRAAACQAVPAVAELVDQVVMTIGTYAQRSAPVELVARAGGADVARSGVVTSANGVMTLPLRPALKPATGPVEICLRNLSSGRLAIAGVTYPPPPGSDKPGRSLSIRLLGPRESASDRIGLALDRYASARAGDFGRWVLVLALLGFAVAALAAIIIVVRAVAAQSQGGAVR